MLALRMLIKLLFERKFALRPCRAEGQSAHENPILCRFLLQQKQLTKRWNHPTSLIGTNGYFVSTGSKSQQMRLIMTRWITASATNASQI